MEEDKQCYQGILSSGILIVKNNSGDLFDRFWKIEKMYKWSWNLIQTTNITISEAPSRKKGESLNKPLEVKIICEEKNAEKNF